MIAISSCARLLRSMVAPPGRSIAPDGTSEGASWRACKPHICEANPSSSTSSPVLATSVSAVEAARRRSGRKTAHSAARPMAGPITKSASGAATPSGQCQTVTASQSTYATSIAIPPEAMLKTPVVR